MNRYVIIAIAAVIGMVIGFLLPQSTTFTIERPAAAQVAVDDLVGRTIVVHNLCLDVDAAIAIAAGFSVSREAADQAVANYDGTVCTGGQFLAEVVEVVMGGPSFVDYDGDLIAVVRLQPPFGAAGETMYAIVWPEWTQDMSGAGS